MRTLGDGWPSRAIARELWTRTSGSSICPGGAETGADRSEFSVRPDAWVQARLQALYEEATASEQLKMNASWPPASLRRRGPQCQGAAASDRLFGFHPAADEAPVELFKRLEAGGRLASGPGRQKPWSSGNRCCGNWNDRAIRPGRAAVARLARFYYSISG